MSINLYPTFFLPLDKLCFGGRFRAVAVKAQSTIAVMTKNPQPAGKISAFQDSVILIARASSRLFVDSVNMVKCQKFFRVRAARNTPMVAHTNHAPIGQQDFLSKFGPSTVLTYALSFKIRNIFIEILLAARRTHALASVFPLTRGFEWRSSTPQAVTFTRAIFSPLPTLEEPSALWARMDWHGRECITPVETWVL